LPVPSSTAPREVPLPPPPVSVSLPLLLIVLEVSMLKATGLAVRRKLPVAVESTVTVTPVLPVWAITAGTPGPEQVTVVPLGGAVLQWEYDAHARVG